MIEGSLEYSYLTAGEAFIFLKIDSADPTTLYYHLAEPGQEVEAHLENFRHCTSVSQVLAFTLLALTSSTSEQDERQRAIERLNTWNEDYETILYAIPTSERKQTPPRSAFKPRTYKDFDRSPYIFRKRKKQGFDPCQPESRPTSRDPSPDLDDDDEAQLPDSHTLPRNRLQSKLTRQPRRGTPGPIHTSDDSCSSHSAQSDSGSEDEAGYETDATDVTDASEGELADSAWLLADNEHPPEYYIRQ